MSDDQATTRVAKQQDADPAFCSRRLACRAGRGQRLIRGVCRFSAALWRLCAFSLVLMQVGGSLLLFSCLAPAIAAVLPSDARIRVGRTTISYIFRSCWATATALGVLRIDADALDALRGEDGGLILAANHPTLLDALIVVAHLPRSICVMRPDLMRSIFLGPGARLAKYIAGTSGASVVRESVTALREGHAVLLFPEGTRTSSAPVSAFKPGITLIAKIAQVPIQTILIRSDSPYLKKGWPLLRVPPACVSIRITLGERFPASDDHRGALQKLRAYFACQLEATRAIPLHRPDRL